MGVCVYTPAFALNAGTACSVASSRNLQGRGLRHTVRLLSFSVTGFELWAAVLATGLVCTLYTTMVSFVRFVFPERHLQILLSIIAVNHMRNNNQKKN